MKVKGKREMRFAKRQGKMNAVDKSNRI